MYLAILALSVLSYLLGSIPFGYLIARRLGVDIRSYGSGNIGATNVGRALGWKWFLLTLLADAAKGFAAVSLVGVWLDEPKVGFYILAGSLAILGHCLPVWLSFRGGKAVATSLGVLVGLLPWGFVLVVVATFGVVFLLSKQVSLGSICAALVAVITKITLGGGFNQQNFELTLFMVGLAALIVYTHKENIKRILSGTEHKVQLPRSL